VFAFGLLSPRGEGITKRGFVVLLAGIAISYLVGREYHWGYHPILMWEKRIVALMFIEFGVYYSARLLRAEEAGEPVPQNLAQSDGL
jgi:hypothetical protein